MSAENEEAGNEMVVVAPSIIEAQERAAIDIQIATAKRYPRDLAQVKKQMLSFATLDEETAAGTFYSVTRGGKTFTGPSVRMAEIAIASYKNLAVGSRVVGNDGKFVTAQAICHDLENNVRITIEVQRRITNKEGKTYSDDMQVVTANAACSIALRNAAFRVIPKAIINPVYEKAKAVAIGDAKSISQRWQAATMYFSKIGKDEKAVLEYLGKASSESIDLLDIEKLLGLRNAIRDGEITIDEAFKRKTPEHGTIDLSQLQPGSTADHHAVDQPLTDKPKRGRPVKTQPPEPTAEEKALADAQREKAKAALDAEVQEAIPANPPPSPELPSDYCADYAFLFTAQFEKGQKTTMQKAIDRAREHEHCQMVKTFEDIGAEDTAQCATIKVIFDKLLAAGQGK
jgi:hypothetical protein